MERSRFVFSGSGGQGVITAAIILAEAAVMHEGLNAVQSQAYGAAARGGATRADVIVSNSEVYYPKVIQPNVLVCLTQEAYNKYHPIIRPGGLLVTDRRYVETGRRVDAQKKEIPLIQSVLDKIGKAIVLNICMLGAIISLTEIVQPDSIMKVLATRIPKDFLEMNQKALELGIELGEASKQ